MIRILHNTLSAVKKPIAISLLVFSCTALIPTVSLAQLFIESSTDIATAGYFNLNWKVDAAGPVQVQQATAADFSDAKTIYSGTDRATVISGLGNGEYYYRIESADNVSPGIKVQVAHHALSRAFVFFGLGAVIFIITLSVLIRGARTD